MRDYITVAGGCFWGLEHLLAKRPAIFETVVGYSGGTVTGPSYDDVKTGITGHAESVKIFFDSEKTDISEILHFFFKIHDPTTKDQQGNDKGSQYRSMVFYKNKKEQEEIIKTIQEVDGLKIWESPIITEVVLEKPFYEACEFHQKYLVKHPDGYTCHFIR